MELQTIILLFQAKAKMWPRWNWRKVVLGVCWVATRRPVGSQPSTRRSIFLVQTINLLVARQGNNAEMRTWTSRKCMFHSESGNLCCDVDGQLKCQFVLGGLIRRLNHEDPWRFRWTSFYWDTWRFCGMNLARKSTKYTLVFDMSVVIYIYIYIRYRIFLHMLIWWNSSNNIYIYTRSRSARKKGIPFFFHFISTEHSVVEFIFAHQGDATCARAAAFVAHRTASWAGRLVAQRVWNTLVKTYRLVGGNTMFVGKLPRGFNLCVQKFGRKGMVCVSTLVWVYMFWCQK